MELKCKTRLPAAVLLLAVCLGGALGSQPAAAFAFGKETVSSGDSEVSSGQEEGKETEASSGQEEGKETEASPGQEEGKETEASPGQEEGKGTEASPGQEEGKGTEASPGQEEGKETETVSSGDSGDTSLEKGSEDLEEVTPGSETGEKSVSSPSEITVPIYSYDILNVLIPASYAVAFNPYGLEIRQGDEEVSTAQVISQNYGIVNKSTRDKLVTIVLTVEDLNGGQIIFADSAEEAMNADEGVLAVYLALVPANQEEIRTDDNQPIGKDSTAEALAKVSMGKSAENAVALKEGENQVIFRLSGAEYDFMGDGFSTEAGENGAGAFTFKGLAADGTGVTAFTFDGIMNRNADWTKLAKGIKISVVYIYENATGEETIVQGTGAMVSR